MHFLRSLSAENREESEKELQLVDEERERLQFFLMGFGVLSFPGDCFVLCCKVRPSFDREREHEMYGPQWTC